MIKDAQWAEDKEATECRQCAKQFSVSRRRVSIALESFLFSLPFAVCHDRLSSCHSGIVQWQ